MIRENSERTNLGYRAPLTQREALVKQIKELKNAERGDAIDWIREQIALFEMRPQDLEESLAAAVRENNPVRSPPSIAIPSAGATWSGRGRTPLWLAGQDRESFLISN